MVAACGGQYDWRAPNRVLVMQDTTDHREATFFSGFRQTSRKMATVQLGKLLQVCWRSRSSFLGGVRKFTAVDNHEAVKVGDLHREAQSKNVVKPKFATDFLGASIREGADALTLRVHEEGVLAFCQAIFHSVEGPDWEAVYYHNKDLHKALKKQEVWREQRRQRCCGP